MFNNPLYLSTHELHYEFLRILSKFRGNFYCNSLATVTLNINVKTLTWNGILVSQFPQNIVEARFLRNIIG